MLCSKMNEGVTKTQVPGTAWMLACAKLRGVWMDVAPGWPNTRYADDACQTQSCVA